MKRELAIVVAVAAAALSAAFAGESPATAPRTVFGTMPKEVRAIAIGDIMAAAAEATPEKYPDADSVILDSVSCEIYEEDGTSILFDDTYTKVLTEKGRRDEASSTLGFDAFYSDLEIAAAEIVKPDGTVVPIDLERNCKTAIDPGMMSANIYDPNDKKTTISYPGLEVGDITRLSIVRREKRVRVPGVWSDYQIFENFGPILRYTYAVSSPASNPVRSSVLRDAVEGTLVSHTETPLDGGARTLLKWDFANVPQAFPEPSMPPMHTVLQRVLLSTLSDWRELSRWYWNLCKPHLDAVSDEMRETVESLVADTADEKEKIWRIFTWVSQNVRYMGVTTETESPGHEPHDVDVTFGRRHGVCRDKAALLAAMLRLADIDAFPVLIHVGEKRDPDVPMSFFNHAVVGVRDADGEYTLMDATNENTADLLPAYLAGKSYLVATPEGETLLTSDEVPAAANMLFASTKAKVDGKGKITMSTKFDFTGLNDSAYRGAFVRMPAERRREFLEGVVRSTVPGAKLESFKIEPEDLRDTEAPLVVRMESSAPDFVVRGDGASLVKIPRFTASVGYINFILDKTGLLERRFPFETEDACGAEETFEIDFESLGDAIALPDNASFKTNGVTYSQSVFANENAETGHRVLKSSRRVEFNLTSYPAEIYRPFKDTLHRIETLLGQVCAFEPSPTHDEMVADSWLISAKTVVDVTSPTDWTKTVTTRRRILNYAGRRANSELKISYNPAWQSVELLEASVSNEDGRVQLVTDSEINEMDAAWAASAPRYPAGKTLVVSFPGVEVGSVISTSYRISQTNAPFFALFDVMNGVTPRDEDSLEIRLHGEAANRYRELKAAAADAGEGDWSRSFLLTYNADDYPVTEAEGDDGSIAVSMNVVAPPTIPREPHTPDVSQYAITFQMSLGDWKEYAGMLRRAVAEATSPANTRRCAELARSLCEGLPDVSDKIVAIRDYVAKNIRLAGPSFTQLPLAPTPADVTLADGYGNSLDRAVLISALLFDAGIDNSVVFASGDEIEEVVGGALSRELALPLRGTFCDPLVEILPDDDDPDSSPIYLNDTDQYATLGMTHHYWQHALTTIPEDPDCGLFGDYPEIGLGNDRDEPVDFPLPIKPIYAAEGLFPGTTTIRAVELEASGDATVEVTKIYHGTGADAILKQYAEMTPELLSRHHQELVGAIAVSAVPVGGLEVDTNSLPYSVKYTARVPGLATRTGNVLSMVLNHASAVSPFDAEERRLPFVMGSTGNSVSLLAVKLPKEMKRVLSKPSSVEWKYSDIGFEDFSRTVVVEPDEDTGDMMYMEMTGRTPRRARSHGPEFYKTLLEMDRQLSRRESNLLVIEVEE